MKLKLLIVQLFVILLWFGVIACQKSFSQTGKPSDLENSAAVYFSSKPFIGGGAQGAEKSAKFKAGSDIYCRVIFNRPLGKIFENDEEDQQIIIFYLYQISESVGTRVFSTSLRVKINSNLIKQNYLDVDLMPAPENAVTNNSQRLADILAGDRYASTNMEERKQVGQIKKFSLNIGVGKDNTKKAGEGVLQVDYTNATVKLLKEWHERDKIAYDTIKSKAEKSNESAAIALVKKLPLPKVFLTPSVTGAGTISYKEISNEEIISMLEQKYQSKIYLFRFVRSDNLEDFHLSYSGEQVVGKTGNKFFFYVYKDAETGACKASPGTLSRRSESGGNYGELRIEDFFLDVGKYIEDVYPKDKNDHYYVDCDKLK